MWILMILIGGILGVAICWGMRKAEDIEIGFDSPDDVRGYTFILNGDYFHITARTDAEAWNKARRITSGNKSVRMLTE